jgi:hypothetical protein
MSVYKSLTTSDVVVTPFKANKSFSFQGSGSFTSSNVGIDRFLGKNITSSFVSGSNPTGQISSYNKQIVYKSIQQLYYSNFVRGEDGSTVLTSSILPDGVRVGQSGIQPMYDNYLSNTLDANRLFPTASGDEIGVIAIPSDLFGEYIKPGTFRFEYAGDSSGTITDDGNGGLFQDGAKIGDIIYQHGMVIITSAGSSITGSVYGSAIYGTGVYSSANTNDLNYLITTNNVTCSFESNLTIYESQYKCTFSPNEYTYTQNPSAISSSSNSGVVHDFLTGSYFQPYITTVGLYNSANQLVAVGKLSQPLQSSNVTDTTILVNLDL